VKKQGDVKQAVDQMAEHNGHAAAEENEKKLKRLAKILAGIEKLEEKQRQGKELTKEELDKVSRRPEVEREIRDRQLGIYSDGPSGNEPSENKPAAASPAVQAAPSAESCEENVVDTTAEAIIDAKEKAATNAAAAAAAAAPKEAEDPEKKAKRLTKLLGAIERLEEKMRHGAELLPEELQKIQRKEECERELHVLRYGSAAPDAPVSASDDSVKKAAPGTQANTKQPAAMKPAPKKRK